MKDHQTTLALDSLKAGMEELRVEILGLRQVLEVVLEKLELGPEERKDLLQGLEIQKSDDEGKTVRRVEHEKSIQQLLDESQGGPKSP